MQADLTTAWERQMTTEGRGIVWILFELDLI